MAVLALENLTSSSRGCAPPARRSPPASSLVERLEVCDLRACADRAASAGAPQVAVLLAAGPLVVAQGGRSVSLTAGEWTLVRGDWQGRLDGVGEARLAILPASLFSDHGLSWQAALMRPFARSAPINRVAFSLLNEVFDASDLRADEGEELAAAVLRVVKKALLGARGVVTARCALRGRIQEFVEWRIRDPRLSPDEIARGLRCTPRHLHRAFESAGETLSQYILRRRLERCREDLCAPENAARSVTEIAFSWGFNNAAHFSRVFKRQFGAAPSNCRRSPLTA